jgi:hypothetical protein
VIEVLVSSVKPGCNPDSSRLRSPCRIDLFEQEHAFLVGRDNIEQAVAVEVGKDSP